MASLGRNRSVKAYFVTDDNDDDDDDHILFEYKIKMFLSKPLRHIRRGRAEFHY